SGLGSPCTCKVGRKMAVTGPDGKCRTCGRTVGDGHNTHLRSCPHYAKDRERAKKHRRELDRLQFKKHDKPLLAEADSARKRLARRLEASLREHEKEASVGGFLGMFMKEVGGPKSFVQLMAGSLKDKATPATAKTMIYRMIGDLIKFHVEKEKTETIDFNDLTTEDLESVLANLPPQTWAQLMDHDDEPEDDDGDDIGEVDETTPSLEAVGELAHGHHVEARLHWR